MKIVLASIILILISCSSKTTYYSSKKSSKNYLSIMQGATTANSTVINFLVPKSFTYDFMITDKSGTIIDKYEQKSFTEKTSQWKVIELYLDNLSSDEVYKIDLGIKNKYFGVKDSRTFTTFKKDSYKILIASCLSDNFERVAFPAWREVEKKKLDMIFLIGDTVYADSYNGQYLGVPVKRKSDLWSRFIDSRNRLGLYKMSRLVPVYATWDDHDYGQADGTKNYSLKKISQGNFRSFFPVKESNELVKGPGVSFKKTIGSNHFYFFDNRSFRGENKASEPHLGKKQLRWLEEQISQDKNVTNWLIQGDQYFGAYHSFDSYEGKHSVEFEAFKKIIKDSKSKAIFISGDRHLYETSKIEKEIFGYKTYELTTSSFHAKLFPNSGRHIKNKRRIKIIDDQYNAMILEIGKVNKVRGINYSGKTIDQLSLD